MPKAGYSPRSDRRAWGNGPGRDEDWMQLWLVAQPMGFMTRPDLRGNVATSHSSYKHPMVISRQSINMLTNTHCAIEQSEILRS